MKKILFLLLCVCGMQAQTLQNPTFGNTTTNTLKVKTPATSTTALEVGVLESDGLVNKMTPTNLPIPQVPLNYSVLSPTIGGHLSGIDTKLGTIVATTAGVTTRVWFTADVSVVSATNYYATNASSKGTLASAIQNVVNNDNVKTYFAQDLIGTAFATATIFPVGVYAGNLSASTSPNSAQQRWTVELYKCNNAGTPIASGITGAPVGSLGVTVVTILDSGLLTLADGSVTNVQVSGNLASPLSVAVGERIRYHVSAEKVGTAGANITQSVYYGTSYNSFIDVPVPLNTTAVQNLSAVTGATTTDALNNLNILKQNYYAHTLIVAKSGGQYSTVQDAVNASVDGDLILIYPGIYEQSVNTIGKDVTLFGFDKYNTVIKTTLGDYFTPPLNCSGGTKAYNLKFLATSEDVVTPPALFSYAVHMDDAGAGITEFNNCILESHQNSAIGIGTHQDQTIIINNCELYQYDISSSYDGGALYMHNSAGAESNQKMIVKNSYIYTDLTRAIKIDDARDNAGGVDTNTTVEFIGNVFESSLGTGSNVFYTANSSIAGGIAGRIQLTIASTGNNIQKFNVPNFDLVKLRGIEMLPFGGNTYTNRTYNNKSVDGDYVVEKISSGGTVTELININSTNQLTRNGDILVNNNYKITLGSNQSGGGSIFYNSDGNIKFTPRTGYGFIFDGGLTTLKNGAFSQGVSGTYAAKFSNNSSKGVIIGYDTTTNIGHIASENPGVAWTSLALNADGGNVIIGSPTDDGVNKVQVTGGIKSTALAGTGTRQVVASSTGVLSATDLAPTSGSYTPVISNTTNVASSSPQTSYYTRIGNIVTVTINAGISATTGSTETGFDVTLPISTVLTSGQVGSGTFRNNAGTAYMPVWCILTSGSKSNVHFTSNGTGAQPGSFTIQYSLL